MQATLPTLDQFHAPGDTIAYHQHRAPYVALVLEGGYEECGNRGRFFAEPGTILLHAAFDSHLDRFKQCRTRVLNLGISELVPSWSFARVDNPDELVRIAEQSHTDAASLLLATALPLAALHADWIDQLAADLNVDPNLSLGIWARRHGLRAEAVSRGFKQVFGISAARFAVETRVRQARRHILEQSLPLSDIAALTGFADQAHMTRDLARFSGESPGRLRREAAKKFKTR
jgi:AraC-like DNA-binding protein